ncbi:MAG TPA: enoyl-CoA hydratase/isomerase family protein [Candidatus Hydrogenedentes bacterium]|nr:enoyl-CoA hydratase/isomerase family protein [Candidatus Hydrogenedentota bacterium]
MISSAETQSSKGAEGGHSIRVDESEGIAYLTLDAPPENMMDRRFFTDFAELTERVLPRLQVEGLIVQGAGKHFSAGADLSELKPSVARHHDSHEAFFQRNVSAFHALTNLSFPVVAVVRGCCLGSGFELALACHFRLATPRAVFALPETQFSLIPGCGGTVRLPELTGSAKAIELILTGRSILAPEALEHGIVDKIVDRKEILQTAEKLIRRLHRTQEAASGAHSSR